jgi:hypothetical protein
VMAGAQEPPTVRAARRGVTLPGTFGVWFARATAQHARDRFDGAAMLVAELAAALGVTPPQPALGALPRAGGTSAPVSSGGGSTVTPQPSARSRGPLLAVVCAGVVAACVGGFAVRYASTSSGTTGTAPADTGTTGTPPPGPDPNPTQTGAAPAP